MSSYFFMGPNDKRWVAADNYFPEGGCAYIEFDEVGDFNRAVYDEVAFKKRFPAFVFEIL